MMTKRKAALWCLVGMLFLIAIVCLLPLPRAVSYQGTGVVYSPDGTPGHKQDIEINGWMKDYLFREDTLAVTVKLGGTEMAGDSSRIYQPDDDVFCYSAMYYRASTNNYKSFSLYFNRERSMFVIDDPLSGIYVAAKDPYADLDVVFALLAPNINLD